MDENKPKEVTVTLKKSVIGVNAIIFLILTALPLVTEVWFATDGKDSTPTWTEMISDHIPWELAIVAYGALALWLPVHFIRSYRSRAKRQ